MSSGTVAVNLARRGALRGTPDTSYRVPMTAEVTGRDRCPKCGAAVRYGDPWCTLCYTDLRPPAPVETAPPPATVAPVVIASPDPLTAPLETVSAPVAGPSWPCATCGTVNAMAHDVCGGCGTPFLSGVHADAPLLELPVVGDITKMSRGQRFALAFAVIAAFALLTLLLGLLFR